VALTEDDIAVLVNGYEGWNRGDTDIVLELVDPEIEWEPGFDNLESGVHRGAEGFGRFVASWLESFDDFNFELELLVQKGDRVVVVARQHGRGRGSGIELEIRVIHVWTVKDRKAIAWWGPRTLAEALEGIHAPEAATVLRGYESFNDGDIESALADLDPGIVWHTYLVPGPGGGTYRGHDGVRELWADVRNVLVDFRNIPERVIAAGDLAVSFVRFCGRGRESGVEVEARIAHVFTFRGGKVARVESIEDREKALLAAGLV
jgi:uncharacterized protein